MKRFMRDHITLATYTEPTERHDIVLHKSVIRSSLVCVVPSALVPLAPIALTHPSRRRRSCSEDRLPLLVARHFALLTARL